MSPVFSQPWRRRWLRRGLVSRSAITAQAVPLGRSSPMSTATLSAVTPWAMAARSRVERPSSAQTLSTSVSGPSSSVLSYTHVALFTRAGRFGLTFPLCLTTSSCNTWYQTCFTFAPRIRTRPGSSPVSHTALALLLHQTGPLGNSNATAGRTTPTAAPFLLPTMRRRPTHSGWLPTEAGSGGATAS